MSELKEGKFYPYNMHSHLIQLDVLKLKVLKGGLKK